MTLRITIESGFAGSDDEGSWFHSELKNQVYIDDGLGLIPWSSEMVINVIQKEIQKMELELERKKNGNNDKQQY